MRPDEGLGEIVINEDRLDEQLVENDFPELTAAVKTVVTRHRVL